MEVNVTATTEQNVFNVTVAQGGSGSQGPKGDPGKSAYEIAVDNGFPGNEQEWLDSLVGPQGEPGEQGIQGPQGDVGESTYEAWLALGNEGTEQDFIDSLKGEPGAQGVKGDTGDAGPAGADGSDGQAGITPHIDETSGNWFIGTTDTSVHAEGPQGPPGTTDSATKYYISSSGLDTNDGLTPETPWLTFDNVLDIPLSQPVEILIKSGDVITGSVGFVGKTAGVKISTYGGLGKGAVQMPATPVNPGINIYNCSNVTISNVTVLGAGAGTWVDKAGIFIFNDDGNPSGENYVIDDCDVSGVGYHGIVVGLWGTLGGMKIKGLQITGCNVHGNIDGILTYGNHDYEYSIENGLLKNNNTYNNIGSTYVTWVHSGNGMVLCGFKGGLVENCRSWNNGQNNNWPDGGPYGIWAYNCDGLTIRNSESFANKTGNNVDGGGFDIDGGCQNCVIEHCYSHDNDGPGILMYQIDNPSNQWLNNTFRFNVSENDGRAGYTGAVMMGGAIDDGIIHDNKIIFSSSGLSPLSGVFVRIDDSETQGVMVKNNEVHIDSGVPGLPSSDSKATYQNNVVITLTNTEWISL